MSGDADTDTKRECAFVPGMRVARIASRGWSNVDTVTFDVVKSVRRYASRFKVTLEGGGEHDQHGRVFKSERWARGNPRIEPATEMHAALAERGKKITLLAAVLDRVDDRVIERMDDETIAALLALAPKIVLAKKDERR